MIKKLEQTYWRGDDYGKTFDPDEFGYKINELIDVVNKKIGSEST